MAAPPPTSSSPSSSSSSSPCGTSSKRVIRPNHCSNDDDNNNNNKYRNNRIKTTKYSLLTFLPLNLFEQFHRWANIYFLFIVILNWVPQVNAFGKELSMIPILFVLSVTAIKDAFEDYRRYRSDKVINHKKVKVFNKQAGNYVDCEWQSIRPGDIVLLSCNDVIPADIILLHSSDSSGICHVDTANLDGENNLKQRHVTKEYHKKNRTFRPEEFTHTVECEPPNLEIYKFNGTILYGGDRRVPVSQQNLLLRGCVVRNTEVVEGIVVYAGHDTKAMLNNKGPRYKRSHLEQQINRDVVWCVIILVIMCLTSSIGTGIFLTKYKDFESIPFLFDVGEQGENPAYQAFIKFWTFIIIYQVMIPLPLYVTIELIKLGQVYFITNDLDLYYEVTDTPMECKALNITEDLGQVDIVFSDKTGTLTENKMTFIKCTIGGVSYCGLSKEPNDGDPGVKSAASASEDGPILDEKLIRLIDGLLMSNEAPDEHTQRVWDFFILLALCNTVVVSRDEDELEENQDSIMASTSSLVRAATTSLSLGTINMSTRSLISPDSGLESYDDQRVVSVSMKPSASNPPRCYVNHVCSASSLHDQEFNGHSVSFDDNDVFTVLPENSKHDRTASLNFTSSWKERNFSNLSIMSENTLKTKYEAESPDELALVKTACSYGCRLLKRAPDQCALWLPGEGQVKVKVLHTLPFDSNRKRMSIIIRHPFTDEIILLTKGADTAVLPLLKDCNEEALARTETHLTEFSVDGLRTLCMAKRVLSMGEYETWLEGHTQAENALSDRDSMLQQSMCDIERDLSLLGATGIEDKLQDGVPETISALREAGIAVWVLTGDKQETALNIAYSCHLIGQKQQVWTITGSSKEEVARLMKYKLAFIEEQKCRMESSSQVGDVTLRYNGRGDSETYFSPEGAALVIDGKTLGFIIGSDLEAQVVKLVQTRLDKLSLAIGDGANDVSMIQTADIGVGISGQEGMQAVMASDFALARFRFLQKLLFVHGHWCYSKLARMTLYMWYKNAVFIFMLLWYQVYSGFSGGTMLDDFNLILFNLVYTSLPPIILGVFDQDMTSHDLMTKPKLYQQGPRREVYTSYSYFVCILDAIWQSLVQFFVPFWVYGGSSVGQWEFGAACMAGSVWIALLHICLETKSFNVFHWLGLALSIALFYVCNLVLGVICIECSPPANPYWVVYHSYISPLHWLSVVITIAAALLPRFLIRSLQASLPGYLSVCVCQSEDKTSTQRGLETNKSESDAPVLVRYRRR